VVWAVQQALQIEVVVEEVLLEQDLEQISVVMEVQEL
jgi:hypothetical protein